MESFQAAAHAILTRSFLGISFYQYLAALGCILAGFVLKRLLEDFLDRVSAGAEKTATGLDDIVLGIVRKPLPLAVLAVGVYFAVQALPLPSEPVDVRGFTQAAFRALTVLFAMWAALRIVDGAFEEWMRHARSTDGGFDEQLIPILQKTLKVFLVVVGLILFLQNMGYSVGSLLAGFGLGGAAVALAAKDSLSNLFGSIVVVFDRPFRVGDWIEMDGIEGTVEEIGLRTTRIRTFSNSLLTVPNMKFTTSVINNWSRMRKRRITFRIGVTYDTPPEKVERAVLQIREIIEKSEDLRQDFYIVNFENFGASSLDILVYCFTRTTSWQDYLEVKQRFLLDIMRRTRALGVEIAFPTQTLHIGSPVPVRQLPA